MSLLDALTAPERRAVALVALIIRCHGGRDGEGLFEGPKRYSVLADRLRLAAEMSRDVRGCLDRLCRELRFSLPAMRFDQATLALTAPAEDDAETLGALAERTHSVVMLARQLAAAERRAAAGEPEPPPFDDALDPLAIFDRAAGGDQEEP